MAVIQSRTHYFEDLKKFKGAFSGKTCVYRYSCRSHLCEGGMVLINQKN